MRLCQDIQLPDGGRRYMAERKEAEEEGREQTLIYEELKRDRERESIIELWHALPFFLLLFWLARGSFLAHNYHPHLNQAQGGRKTAFRSGIMLSRERERERRKLELFPLSDSCCLVVLVCCT